MKEIMTTNYFWGQDVEMTQFIRMPMTLFSGAYFSNISLEAKVLYGLMLNRVSLSIKNGWQDEEGKTYIHYSVSDIMCDLGKGKNKVLEALKELEEVICLIERKKQGQGRPDIIYVKNFVIEEEQEEVQEIDSTEIEPQNSRSPENKPLEVYNSNLKKFENQTSRSPENKLQGVCNANPSYINNIYAECNNTNQINPADEVDVMEKVSAYMELIRENINYDEYMEYLGDRDKELYDELYQLICEVVCIPRKSIRIAGEEYPYNLVKGKFLKLNSQHLQYVIGCMERNTTKVANIKAYLITALYNAPNTMNHYYTAEVNHDMHRSSKKEKNVGMV